MTVCERGKKQGLYFHVELVLHFDLQQPALLRGMLREGCQSPMTAHTFYVVLKVANARNVRWRTSERTWQVLLKAQTLIQLAGIDF